MKTKFKFLTVAVATLLLGFTSCSNDEDGGKPETGNPKNMFLKISSDTPSTYAEGTPQAAGEVTFTSGDLYFTDNAGTILAHYTISSAATSDTNIDIAALTSTGQTITNLPGTVSNVHVVGNTNGLATSGNISRVKNQALQVQSQGTISNVNLYGEAATVLVTPGTPGVSNDLYAAAVTLAPTVARIELANITATGTAITGFEVEGIFIDNYYSEAAVAGTVAAGNLQDNNTAVAADWVSGSSIYPVALDPSIFDWYTTPLTSDANVVAPATSGDVWGYNVFATTLGSTVPRIVIRLSNITTTPESGITFAGPQFITVKGFKNGATPLTAIKAGEVYNIAVGALAFDETNITPVPNVNAIDVEVTVTVANWSVVNVTPEI